MKLPFHVMRRRLFVWVFCIAAALAVPAQASLTILPTRVLFEGRDRFAEITLINTGKETETYEMGWRFFTIDPQTSRYVDQPGPTTAFDLSKHIVFTPRRVTLQPGEKQKIRLALRPPAEAPPPGEYRAHFQFTSGVDDRAAAGDAAAPAVVEKGQTGAAIKINVGYSIPVFYTVGESDAGARIDTLALRRDPQRGTLVADIDISRTGGPYSTHGYLYVYHQPAGGGAEKVVGEISNAHIFPEVNRRAFPVTFTDSSITGGSLRVVYRHFDRNKDLVYAERVFPLQ